METTKDITERQRIEEALYLNELQVHALLQLNEMAERFCLAMKRGAFLQLCALPSVGEDGGNCEREAGRKGLEIDNHFQVRTDLTCHSIANRSALSPSCD